LILSTMIVCASAGFPPIAAAQTGCLTSADAIVTDRPGATNSPLAVPYGSAQVESGVQWTGRNRSNVVDGTETILRFGVAECTEFDVQVPDYFYAINGPAASGFSDVTAGFNHQFTLNPGNFIFGAGAGITFPSGANAVSNHGYNPYVQFMWSRNLPYEWSLSGMFIATWYTSQPAQNPTLQPSVQISRNIGRYASAFAEYYGDYNHQRPSQIVDGGFLYPLTLRQQIDLSAGFGLNSSSPSQFVGAGYSFRLDDIF